MDQDKVPLITDRYHKWLQKQLQGKGSEVRLLMRRTMNTAIAVRCGVEKIPFEELTKNLFFFCSDPRTKEFTRLYEAQIELASINEEKFIKGLHKFYNETAIRIKKENLYQEFFEFISLSMRVRGERILANGARDDEKFAVIDAFQSILMQQLEYLRPNKFDFSVVLCGQTTDGELMTVKDTLPDFDVPGYEIQDAPYSGKKISSHAEMKEFICATYRRHGFQVHTFKDVEALFNEDKIYTNHHCSLCPYINEYTYDILPDPDHPLTTAISKLLAFRDEKIDGDELVEKLRHRARTLPTNGVEFHLESKEKREDPDPAKCDILSSVLLKELLYDDTVIMLYKVCTYFGDISGYYDTKDGMFYSVLIDAPDFDLYNNFRSLVLYLYACMVCRDGAEMLKRAEENSLFYYAAKEQADPEMPIYATPFSKGGKLLNMYHPERNESVSSPTGKRAGNDKYGSEEKAIQGFIRRVGAGKSPSLEAVARAEALGYELAPNETYVQPFIRRVLKLKKNLGEKTE